jgi:hypothetical protein
MSDRLTRSTHRARIDFANLSPLPAVRREEMRPIEKLAAAKERRRKRKPGKAHATGKDISIAAKAKAKRAKARREANAKAAHKHLSRVRAYWFGLAEEHP